jgi:hypothetical protein
MMAIPNKYDIGDQVILHAETLVDDALVSVTGQFKVKRPGTDELDDVTTAQQSQGIYEGIYVPEVGGRHFYRFIASGTQVGEEEYWFDVREAHA